MFETSSTSHDVARAAGGLDNEAVRIQSLQNITNDLANRLEGGKIVLGLLVSCDESFDVFAHSLQASFDFAVLADLGTILLQDLFAFRLSLCLRCSRFRCFPLLITVTSDFVCHCRDGID